MRVLQLIDSLNPGGAERMAVSLANSLANKIDKSYLCATRKEGVLKEELKNEVTYYFLGKKRALDLNALFRLKRIISDNSIDLIHAHSTSFFLATLLKISGSKVKVIWHDHYGHSEMLDRRGDRLLRYCSRYFDAVISVNIQLKKWAEEKLRVRKVKFLSNFVSLDPSLPSIVLKEQNSIKIVVVANLRPQKDYLNLLRAFKIIQKTKSNVSLHLIGGLTDKRYVSTVAKFIDDHNLSSVFVYGTQLGIQKLLKSADIGVLSSISEGLPLSLIEYGTANLAVVCTNVGECSEVVQEYGKIVPPKNAEALANAILFYIENETIRQEHSNKFSKHIQENYSEAAIIPKLLEIYKTSTL
ncbi:MAG: glycosyltransferase [Aequorivita sp.]|nr:glycosyltransferase [Aequorivita sp.]|tara:strand:+ start:30053 stop:31120 length:1068 start_codon:yes stop_codon:yes gene_type:complete